MPRDGILDPPGRAVEAALPQLGARACTACASGGGSSCRSMHADAAMAREVVEKLAADFLANPLIESWQIEEVEAVPA